MTISAVAQASASMQVSASTVTDATWLFNGPPVRASIVWDRRVRPASTQWR